MAYEARPLNDYFLAAPILMDPSQLIHFAVPEPGYLVKVMSVMDIVPGANVGFICVIDGVTQTKGNHTMLTAGELVGMVNETEIEEGPIEDQDVYVNSSLKFISDGLGTPTSKGSLLVVIRRDGQPDDAT